MVALRSNSRQLLLDPLAELREAGEFLRVGTVGGAVLAIELREENFRTF